MRESTQHIEAKKHGLEALPPDLAAALYNNPLLDRQSQSPYPVPYFWEWKVARRAETIQATDPELVDFFVRSHTDGLHGTRSGSLLSIVEHGIVPQADHDSLSSVPITGEHETLPKPREVVHLLHWLNAEGTRRYAGDTPAHRYKGGLTLENYVEALSVDDEFIEQIDPAMMFRAYFETRKRDAARFDAWLTSGAASDIDILMHAKDFPVVLGVNVGSREISVSDGSSIEGDCQVRGSIQPEEFTVIFVPGREIEFTAAQIGGFTNTPLLPIERLRSATEQLQD
jgi:hypothetical protein